MLGLLGAVADFERSLLLQRQTEGIDQARELGFTGITVTEAARRVGVSRSVFIRATPSATKGA